MWLMIMLNFTKKQGFTLSLSLSLEDFSKNYRGEGQIDPHLPHPPPLPIPPPTSTPPLLHYNIKKFLQIFKHFQK